MAKFFSSEVADLESVLALLLRCDAQVSFTLCALCMPCLPPFLSKASDPQR